MKSGEAEEGIRQIAMQVLCRMEYGAIGCNAEINLKEAEIQNSAVIHERDQPHDRRDEHQRVQNEMNRPGKPTRQNIDAVDRHRRRVSASPPKTGDEHKPQCQAKQRMNVDPESLRLLRPRVMQQT